MIAKEVCRVGTTKIKDLTVGELKALISDAVKESVEDLIEDLLALSSDEYLRSIEEARKDYKEGRVKYFEEIFDV
jgi:hypothetical protein